jgi:hypothetical protein
MDRHAEHATAGQSQIVTDLKSIFDHPFFRKAPAFAALLDKDDPTPEHLRACLMELARFVLGNVAV